VGVEIIAIRKREVNKKPESDKASNKRQKSLVTKHSGGGLKKYENYRLFSPDFCLTGKKCCDILLACPKTSVR